MRSSYGLEICYNDAAPLVQYSPDRGGVSVHLHNADDGELALKAQVNVMGEIQRYWIRALRVGDRISFRYVDGPQGTDSHPVLGPTSWEHLNQLVIANRPLDTFADGQRLGLSVGWRDQPLVHCAYPTNGGFSFILTNAPVSTARGFVMAGNDNESWSWGFSDLHPGETCRVELVAIERWDEPHRTTFK